MWIASIALCFVSVQGQKSGLPHTDFAKDLGGWASINPAGKLSVSHDVVQGQAPGSLKFEYSIAQGQMDAIMLQTHEMPLGKMNSLRFWVRPDHDTSFGVFLQENDGGRYVAIASAKKDAWQLVELSPSDFTLSDGPDDPQDQNGKLDLSLVAGIGIGDFKQMLAQAGPELIALFGVKLGAHAFYLSDFLAAETSLPESWSKTDKEAKIDTFERPQPGWVCAGQASMTVVRDGPIIGKALKVEYSVGPKSLAALFRSLVPGTLSGMSKLEFSLASSAPCKLFVQVEERSGGKYNTVIVATGGPDAKQFVIPFIDFEEADDSKDTNNKLDLGDVKQILFLDLSGMQEAKEKTNTLWLGPVVAKAGA